MIKIEVTHVIKFDTQAESLVGMIAQAIAGAMADKAPVAQQETKTVDVPTVEVEAKQEETKLTENIATKTRYFVHEGTDELVVVKKGESLEFLETDIFDEVTAAVYKDLKAKREEQATETVSEEKTETTPSDNEPVETDQPALKIEDLRMIAAKFVSAAKQKELKALFGEFEDVDGNAGIKLSSIQEKDYHAFVERAKERLAELGVE